MIPGTEQPGSEEPEEDKQETNEEEKMTNLPPRKLANGSNSHGNSRVKMAARHSSTNYHAYHYSNTPTEENMRQEIKQ